MTKGAADSSRGERSEIAEGREIDSARESLRSTGEGNSLADLFGLGGLPRLLVARERTDPNPSGRSQRGGNGISI